MREGSGLHRSRHPAGGSEPGQGRATARGSGRHGRPRHVTRAAWPGRPLPEGPGVGAALLQGPPGSAPWRRHLPRWLAQIEASRICPASQADSDTCGWPTAPGGGAGTQSTCSRRSRPVSAGPEPHTRATWSRSRDRASPGTRPPASWRPARPRGRPGSRRSAACRPPSGTGWSCR